MGYRVLDGALRDLVKDDPMHRFRIERFAFLEDLDHVPRDRFTFAIWIRGEVERVGLLHGPAEGDHVLLVPLDRLVVHVEVVVRLYRTAFRYEIAHVTVRRQHLEVRTEVLLDGARLRGRLDDYQIARHCVAERTGTGSFRATSLDDAGRGGTIGWRRQWSWPDARSNTKSSIQAYTDSRPG